MKITNKCGDQNWGDFIDGMTKALKSMKERYRRKHAQLELRDLLEEQLSEEEERFEEHVLEPQIEYSDNEADHQPMQEQQEDQLPLQEEVLEDLPIQEINPEDEMSTEDLPPTQPAVSSDSSDVDDELDKLLYLHRPGLFEPLSKRSSK